MLRSSQFNIIVSLPETSDVVLVNGVTGAMDVVAGPVAAGLGGAHSGGVAPLLSEAATAYLLTRGYLTELDAEGERAHARAAALGRESAEYARRRKFYLMPTYACQLRCTYCFEHDVRSRGRREGWADTAMQSAVAEAAFCAMEEIEPDAHAGRQCTLFGGEALLPENRDAVRDIAVIARRRGFGLMAATNAFDLDHYADLLGPQGIAGVHVPLDGPESVHDRMRVAKGGGPSFRRIVDNLKLALAAGVRVRLRVNVNAAALTELDDLANLLEAEGFFAHPRFSSYVKAIFATKPGSTQTQQLVLSGTLQQRLAATARVPDSGTLPPPRGLVTDADVAHKLASSDRLSRYFSGYPVIHDRVDALFAARPDDALRPSHCGTSSLQILIFDPRGDVYPCNNLVGRPEHRVATFHPSLQWHAQSAAVWRERTVASMPEVAACKYAMFCGGGCAFDGFVASGSVQAKSCDCADFGETFAGMVAASYRRIVRPMALTV